MQILNEYGYGKSGVMADFGCPLCRRIVYIRAPFDSVPERERKGVCAMCAKAQREAERRSAHLWELAQPEQLTAAYAENVPCLGGDLLDYLVGLKAGTRVQRLYRRLGLSPPNRLIPLHDAEW
jgi:hypothetical protein